jgi:cytochrome c
MKADAYSPTPLRYAMRYATPQSLSNNEYYAIIAYVLFLNELIGEEDKVDAASLPKLAMPNRDGFVLAARPDTANNPLHEQLSSSARGDGHHG